MKRVLVTGAGGFVGSRVVSLLDSCGDWDITAAYRSTPVSSPDSVHVQTQCLDLTNSSQIDTLFQGDSYDAVIHCAAYISGKTDAQALEGSLQANVIGHTQLAHSAAHSGTRLFLFCSTSNLYGDVTPDTVPSTGVLETHPLHPENPYAWSKQAGEAYLEMLTHTHTMTSVCLRLAGVHGPRRTSGAVYHMLNNAHRGQDVTVHEPKSIFNLLFVEDAALALIACLNHAWKKPFSTYNIGGEAIQTLKELALAAVRMADSGSTVVCANNNRARCQVFDSRAFTQDLNFTPKSTEQRLRETLDWIRSQD